VRTRSFVVSAGEHHGTLEIAAVQGDVGQRAVGSLAVHLLARTGECALRPRARFVDAAEQCQAEGDLPVQPSRAVVVGADDVGERERPFEDLETQTAT
jgi:hypothetical protein